MTATDTWEALHRAHVTLTRTFGARPEFKGLSLREYDALDVLARAGEAGMRLNRLNDHLPLTQSSLSRMTERLENRGLVSRWQDPDDHRGLRIALTEYGAQLRAQIANVHQQHVAQVLRVLSEDEQATLAALADRLREAAQ